MFILSVLSYIIINRNTNKNDIKLKLKILILSTDLFLISH
jgi:hypothetical protein